MGKCVCPPTKGSKPTKSPKKSSGSGGGKSKDKAKALIVTGSKGKKSSNRTANMFILYFLDMFRKYRGNMYCMAKECGRRWWTLPQSEKDKYKRMYCTKCKACRSCRPKKL